MSNQHHVRQSTHSHLKGKTSVHASQQQHKHLKSLNQARSIEYSDQELLSSNENSKKHIRQGHYNANSSFQFSGNDSIGMSPHPDDHLIKKGNSYMTQVDMMFNDADYQNPFLTNRNSSPPTKHVHHISSISLPKQMANKNQRPSRNDQQQLNKSRTVTERPKSQLRTVSRGREDQIPSHQRPAPSQDFGQFQNQNQLTNTQSSGFDMRSQKPLHNHSVLTPDQVTNMSVDEIIAAAQQNKKNLSNFSDFQTRDSFSNISSPHDTRHLPINSQNNTLLNQIKQSLQLQDRSPMSRQQPQNYEKMIESKVFNLMNGYFKQQLQQQQQDPSSQFQSLGSHSQQRTNTSHQMPLPSTAYPPYQPRDLSMTQSSFNDLHHLFNQSPGTQHYSNNPQLQQQQQQFNSNNMRYPVHQQHPQYQRSMSPIIHRGQHQSNEEIIEIKNATFNLSKDMKIMKKLIEDMQMSLNEKDAEIIKLNMHLGDEKKKFQNFFRKQSQKSLMNNASSSSLIKKSLDTSQANFGFQDIGSHHDQGANEVVSQLKEENHQLTQENAIMKKQLQEILAKHKDEIKKYEEAKSKEKQKNETHTKKLEAFIADLQKEIKKHQGEVEKALKIHKANEKLMAKNEEYKKEIEKLKEDLNSLQDKDFSKITEIQPKMSKSSINNNDAPCRVCLATLQEKEELVIQVEDLKRKLQKTQQDNGEHLMQQIQALNTQIQGLEYELRNKDDKHRQELDKKQMEIEKKSQEIVGLKNKLTEVEQFAEQLENDLYSEKKALEKQKEEQKKVEIQMQDLFEKQMMDNFTQLGKLTDENKMLREQLNPQNKKKK